MTHHRPTKAEVVKDQQLVFRELSTPISTQKFTYARLASFISTPPLKSSFSSSFQRAPLRRHKPAAARNPIYARYVRGKAVSSTRVFLPGPFNPGDVHTLLSEESTHLRARRVAEGAHVTLFDGSGVTARGLLGPDSSVTVLSVNPSSAKTKSISALIALPKAPSRADWAVEKLVELGITRIHWIRTERVVAAIPNDARTKRWNRLAVSAAKQSLRADIPPIESLPEWGDVLALAEHADLTFVLSPNGRQVLSEECINLVHGAEHVLVVVGPEGGLTEHEEQQLENSGAMLVGLGTHRLRVETAAVAAVSIIAQIQV